MQIEIISVIAQHQIFITIAINFVIVAFVMFLVVKAINKAKAIAIMARCL